VYRSAVRQPEKFFIGIDANVRPLARISEKIYRRPEKGGAPNVLFLQAAIEELPDELDGIASEMHIQFPWGSLLRGVALEEQQVLKGLRRLCRDNALLEVIIGVDAERDQSELRRLGLPELSGEYLENKLAPAYEADGFRVNDFGILSASQWPEIESTWAKKLRQSPSRMLVYLRATAI
jgi:16S rRNA (adenine(1408)-N(1))-methyltransferase